MNDNPKQKVFAALKDPNWDWRTMEGLEKATGLSRGEISRVVSEHISKIETSKSQEHGMVYRLKKTKESLRDEPLIQRALDYLTLGKNRNIA